MILFHSILFIFLILIKSKSIYSSVPFIMNPGCNLTQCINSNYPALFYANQFIGDDTIHIFYSSLDELTIGIFQTQKGYGPHINYTALFNKNYSNAISFGDISPTNSFTLILRRLIQFNDSNDTGQLNENDYSMKSYFLKDLKTNFTKHDQNILQPYFQLPINDIQGLLTIDIDYPGESTREKEFPKLCSTPKSYFLNIALKTENILISSTRFALEFYMIQYGKEGLKRFTTSYIDDQYTPGIFNVWQIQSLSLLYPSSMLWKPIVYQTVERAVGKNTLMQIYDLKNNISLSPLIDQGIYRSLYSVPYVSALNISLGRQNDGFFIKTNHSFIQLTAGLDILEMDSIQKYITIALIISVALPISVALIAIIVICKRRCSQSNISSYDPIDD